MGVCRIHGCDSKDFYESYIYLCKYHKKKQARELRAARQKQQKDMEKELEKLRKKVKKKKN